MSSVSEMLPEHPDDGVYHGNIVDDLAGGQIELQISLVSPERELYSGNGHWITAPGVDGQFGVWPRHMSMVAALGSGKLRIGLPEHERLEYLVRGAFLSVNANVVTVLVDTTVSSADEIDVEATREELAEVTERLGQRLDPVEYTQYQDRQAWCKAKLRFAEAS